MQLYKTVDDVNLLLNKFSAKGVLFTIGYNKVVNEYAIRYETTNEFAVNKLLQRHKQLFTCVERYEPSMNMSLYYFTANLINTNKIIQLLNQYRQKYELVGISNAARRYIIGVITNTIKSSELLFEYKKGKRVEYAIAKFNYNIENVETVKKLGAVWDKSNQYWKITLDYASCSALLESADLGTISLSDELRNKCNAVIDLSEQLIAYSQAVELPSTDIISINLPSNVELHPFQEVGIKYIQLTDGKTLIADEMGTGKTITTLAYLNTAKNAFPALIVCPKTVKYNWYNEAKKWLVNSDKLKISIIDSSVKLLDKSDVYIINYDILYRYVDVFINRYKLNSIIADEAHYVKNPSARRTKAISKLIRKFHDANVIFLTGTPITRSPIDVYNLVALLKPSLFRTQHAFVHRYCDAKYKTIYRKVNNIPQKKKVLDISGASNLTELQKILRGTVMIRRLKEDVLKQLPPITRTLVPVAVAHNADLLRLNDEVVKLLEQLGKARQLRHTRDSSSVIRDIKNNTLTTIPKLRKLIFTMKYNYILEMIDDILDNTYKLVVFVFHREFQEKLMEACTKYKPSGFHGGVTSAKARAEQCNLFTDGDSRIFIATYGAASEGITLTSASYILMAELDWNAKNIAQAEARVHRDTQTKPVTAYYPVLIDTLDEQVYELLKRKLFITNQTLNTAALEGESTAEFIDQLADTIYLKTENNTTNNTALDF